jgi:hypothetical protein
MSEPITPFDQQPTVRIERPAKPVTKVDELADNLDAIKRIRESLETQVAERDYGLEVTKTLERDAVAKELQRAEYLTEIRTGAWVSGFLIGAAGMLVACAIAVKVLL